MMEHTALCQASDTWTCSEIPMCGWEGPHGYGSCFLAPGHPGTLHKVYPGPLCRAQRTDESAAWFEEQTEGEHMEHDTTITITDYSMDETGRYEVEPGYYARPLTLGAYTLVLYAGHYPEPKVVATVHGFDTALEALAYAFGQGVRAVEGERPWMVDVMNGGDIACTATTRTGRRRQYAHDRGGECPTLGDWVDAAMRFPISEREREERRRQTAKIVAQLDAMSTRHRLIPADPWGTMLGQALGHERGLAEKVRAWGESIWGRVWE